MAKMDKDDKFFIIEEHYIYLLRPVAIIYKESKDS